jgi:DNA-binding CsgD family transcriptional regulator
VKTIVRRYERSIPDLTKREREIVRWISLGKTSREIGEILDISARTVEWHTYRMMKKMRATSRMHIIMLLLANGVTL